ncbi:MAG: iron-sulfur cluster carrier protein ApbC [Candidatus Obscuribacterales bacterium]|nr:iron-sulfur cluster carrier protein ApbC [Steroidobacteraceae bacterium]
MTQSLEQAVIDSLKAYPEPYLGRDLWSCGAIDKLQVVDGRVILNVLLGFPALRYATELQARLVEVVLAVPQVRDADVEIRWQVMAHGGKGSLQPLKQIKNIIAVASGKGGVGKSTTAVNLALGLAHEGAAVGILDADIYGPSQPRMLGLDNERPSSRDGKTIQPPEAYGVKLMSIGLLIDAEQPMVWRGPMVTQALNQLLTETQWGELDYLIIDMPPGTGDTQLTLSQRVPLSGAVIVTTPQDIALLDARKGLKMFQKVDVPVLGVVENMSTHICSQCGHEEHIFGAGGGRRMAEQYAVDLLGELPLDIRIREQADGGRPTVVAEPDSNLGRAYIDFARRTAARLSLLSAPTSPTITIEQS